MIDTIIIEKEYIQFGNIKVYPPFTREKVDAILGVPRIEEYDAEIDKGKYFHTVNYIWDKYGIHSSDRKLQDIYDHFVIYTDKINTQTTKVDDFYTGKIFIGNKEYSKSDFKLDKYGMCHQKKFGPFMINTFLVDRIDEADERNKNIAELLSKQVEICYKAPRPKTSVYDIKKLDEHVLKFHSFQFKLLLIEELMHRKGILPLKFDIYDYAQKNSKREIDVEEEGYEEISEAKKWFKDYEIPARLANEITELSLDGGLDVFRQIYPSGMVRMMFLM